MQEIKYGTATDGNAYEFNPTNPGSKTVIHRAACLFVRNHFNTFTNPGRLGDYLIMAGITTSETLAGEQPKKDNLGSRVDELTKQVGELRKECVLLRCSVDDKFEATGREIQKQLFDEVECIIGKIDGLNDRLEKLEEKNSDEEQL